MEDYRNFANFDDEYFNLKVQDTGIDAMCFVIEKKRALRLFKSLNLQNKLRLTTRNKAINAYTDQKFNSDLHSLGGKYPFKKRYINFNRGGKSLTNTLILLENTTELNKLCKERKKKFGTYVMIIFAGLYQPSREIKPQTLRVLRAFLKRFNTRWVDIAKDVIAEKERLKKDDFKMACKNINKGSIIQVGNAQNGVTLYANNCVGDIKKVLIYDKFSKESIYHKLKLDKHLNRWRRVEMRIEINRKFSKVKKEEIKEYSLILDDIVNFYSCVPFGISEETLNKQLNYFEDGRKIFKSENKFKEFVA